MKTIAIIGHGYVGKAMANFFKDHFEVIIVDPYQQTSKEFEDMKHYTNGKAHLAVVCVPTPMSDDGSADLSALESTFEWLEVPLALIKSTVPPNTTRRLQGKYGKIGIAFSPEYIGEGGYQVPFWKGYPDPHQMKLHDFFIIGGDRNVTSSILEFFKPVWGAEVRYFQTDSTTAELCKYMENAFLATKVTFCNEMYDIAESLGVDYDELRELWLLDGRMGRSHTAVFKDKRGFGGKCLPKDVNALVRRVQQTGYEPDLLKAVLETNNKIRNGNKTEN